MTLSITHGVWHSADFTKVNKYDDDDADDEYRIDTEFMMASIIYANAGGPLENVGHITLTEYT